VTELEIQDGIMKAKNINDHCLVYRRVFRDLTNNSLVHTLAPRFIDVAKTPEVSRFAWAETF